MSRVKIMLQDHASFRPFPSPPLNRYTQMWFLDFCDALGEDSEDTANLFVYEADDSVSLPIMCPLQYFKIWCVRKSSFLGNVHVGLMCPPRAFLTPVARHVGRDGEMQW